MFESLSARLARLLAYFFVITLVILQAGCRGEESNKPEGYTPPEQDVDSQITQHENESAYETVLRQLKKNPDNIKARYHLAQLYYRDGIYDKAVENYRLVLKAQPERGFVYFRLATSLSRLQRYEEALEAFKESITRLPDTSVPVAYNNMAIAYGQLGRYQEEIDALRKALEYRPRYASALYNLGATMLKTGDIEGALEQYETLNEIDLTMAQALKKEIDKAAGAGQNTTIDK